jgi:hypothetical protein
VRNFIGFLLSHYAMIGGERDRVHFGGHPPMAQAYRHDACADRLQLKAFAATGVGDVKARKSIAGMRRSHADRRAM